MKQIKVRMSGGDERLFPYYVLDHLVKKRAITAFERSDGWVYIDRDPVRKGSSSESFTGTGRRFTDHPLKRRVTDRLGYSRGR
jgi:hypothetical protein